MQWQVQIVAVDQAARESRKRSLETAKVETTALPATVEALVRKTLSGMVWHHWQGQPVLISLFLSVRETDPTLQCASCPQ